MDAYYDERIHVSQMACSQHGRRNALTASLLQMAQRSLMGMSSGARELGKVSVNEKLRISLGGAGTNLMSSAWASEMDRAMSSTVSADPQVDFMGGRVKTAGSRRGGKGVCMFATSFA